MIFFTQQLEGFREWLQTQSFSQLCVLTDDHTAQLAYPILAKTLEGIEHLHFTIASGEQAKILPTCAQIWEFWLTHHLDRKALIINLGGGVLGDMGGFCAATYKRGIRFVQMPTTLLSQVDASVGGKLGIDFQGFKNVIGSFESPLAVWIDVNFLKTLPTRELRSGVGEILKHCLIADADAWRALPASFSPTMDWDKWVRHSVEIKSRIVGEDMHEQNVRKLLNFGHTIGHAIETYFLNEKPAPLLHGEAVAWGMIAESFLSMRYAGFSQASFAEVAGKIRAYFPEQYPLAYEEKQTVARLALQDKKNVGTTINCVLLQSVGKAIFDVPISEADIIEAMNE